MSFSIRLARQVPNLSIVPTEAYTQSVIDNVNAEIMASYAYKSDDAVVDVYSVNAYPPGITASGFLISSDGYVVTAASNVTYLSGSSVKLSRSSRIACAIKNINGSGNSMTVDYQIVGIDGVSNIAVLKPSTSGIVNLQRYMYWGTSEALSKGDKLSILSGFPFSGTISNYSAVVQNPQYINIAQYNVNAHGMIYVSSDIPCSTVPIPDNQYGNGYIWGAPAINSMGLVVGMVSYAYPIDSNMKSTSVFLLPQQIMQTIVAKIVSQSGVDSDGDYIKSAVGWQFSMNEPELQITNSLPSDLNGLVITGLSPNVTLPFNVNDIIVSVNGVATNNVATDSRNCPTNITWSAGVGSSVTVVYKDSTAGFAEKTVSVTLVDWFDAWSTSVDVDVFTNSGC